MKPRLGAAPSTPAKSPTRRGFLRRMLASAAGGIAGAALDRTAFAQDDARHRGEPAAAPAPIRSIERSILWNGRKSGTTWFHPRPCALASPGESGPPVVLMTLQEITGSDVYGQVHFTISNDLGKSFSPPRQIEAFRRRSIAGGLEMGVCDVVPQFHRATGTVLAMGHNVYYKDGRLTRPSEQRYPVYSVRAKDGSWSAGRKLAWEDPRATAMHTCGCGQRLVVGDGKILVPLSFAPLGRRDRAVGTVLCSFDGQQLEVLRAGNELRNTAGRGLLEPSLTRFGKRFLMTIRAEDRRGYVSTSKDGLHWGKPRAWSWDDGEPLTMSTTQQHWLQHGDRLFLVYTRRSKINTAVMRWRAPLYLAEVDPVSLHLIRSSERIALPLIGDGVTDGSHVARMGNFHTAAITAEESWVSVGEILPRNGWRGNVLLARIRWA